MDVRKKLVELIANAKRSMWGKNGLSCDLARNMYLAENLIAHGVTVQEWISVDDRLPTWRDGKVLVFTKYGFSICERTVNNRWQGHHANWITHWSYLPQPPKGE